MAQLNREDYIDVIISDDSDTLVFGGLNVLRLSVPFIALGPN